VRYRNHGALALEARHRYIAAVAASRRFHETTGIRGAVMAGMDDRKDAFEKKFAHDEELTFKATARRNKLLGLWAAEKLGKSGDEAEAYAKSVVLADFEEAGDDDVIRKVLGDLKSGGVDQSEHQVRRTLDELMARAIDEIKAKG
jgi:hypothetical protein